MADNFRLLVSLWLAVIFRSLGATGVCKMASLRSILVKVSIAFCLVIMVICY